LFLIHKDICITSFKNSGDNSHINYTPLCRLYFRMKSTLIIKICRSFFSGRMICINLYTCRKNNFSRQQITGMKPKASFENNFRSKLRHIIPLLMRDNSANKLQCAASQMTSCDPIVTFRLFRLLGYFAFGIEVSRRNFELNLSKKVL